MTAQHLIQADENDECISVWREANGSFTIQDRFNENGGLAMPQVEISADLAEEIANAILKSILVNGR